MNIPKYNKKFALFHTSTKTWVLFRNQTIFLTGSTVDASIENDPNILYRNLYHSSFNGDEDYGKVNFLEFKLTELIGN